MCYLVWHVPIIILGKKEFNFDLRMYRQYDCD